MFECTLTFQGVDPKLDLSRLADAFFDASIMHLCDVNRLSEGLLSVNLSVEELVTETELPLTKAIRVAQSVVGDATLMEVGPDVVNAYNIAYWLQLNNDHLDTTMCQEWFPEPIAEDHASNFDEDFWHLDEVMEAIKQNGQLIADNPESLLQSAKAARVINTLLQKRS